MTEKDYYSTKKILDIIKYYHINIKNIKEIERETKSVGVSQYGIESSLPKGNKISNIVEQEAIRQIESTKFWSDIITDMKYIQDRWHRVTDEKEAKVLNLRLDGYSVIEISELLGIRRSHVYRLLDNIAETIRSYPQNNDTNGTKETDFVLAN